MKSLAFRRVVSALVLLVAVMMAITAVSPALAQAPTVPPGESPPANRVDTTDMDDDDAGNWGLLGLVGLLGLAGLMRRDRARPIDRPMERSTERAGRL
jgi:MYXO-CTERM domain-containing protein